MPSYLDVVFFANGPDFLFHFEFLVGDLFLVNEIDDTAGCRLEEGEYQHLAVGVRVRGQVLGLCGAVAEPPLEFPWRPF